jgi:hypothetical protein
MAVLPSMIDTVLLGFDVPQMGIVCSRCRTILSVNMPGSTSDPAETDAEIKSINEIEMAGSSECRIMAMSFR